MFSECKHVLLIVGWLLCIPLWTNFLSMDVQSLNQRVKKLQAFYYWSKPLNDDVTYAMASLIGWDFGSHRYEGDPS